MSSLRILDGVRQGNHGAVGDGSQTQNDRMPQRLEVGRKAEPTSRGDLAARSAEEERSRIDRATGGRGRRLLENEHDDRGVALDNVDGGLGRDRGENASAASGGRRYDSDIGQVVGAIYDHVRNYIEMDKENIINNDPYWHCKANCEATARGPVGEKTSKALEDVKEFYDFHIERAIRGIPLEQRHREMRVDRFANRWGRDVANGVQGNEAEKRMRCPDGCVPLHPLKRQGK